MKYEINKIKRILSKKIYKSIFLYILIVMLQINVTCLFTDKVKFIILTESLGIYLNNSCSVLNLLYNISLFSIITYYILIYDLKNYNVDTFLRQKYKNWIIYKILINLFLIIIIKVFVYFFCFFQLLFYSKNIHIELIPLVHDIMFITTIQFILFVALMTLKRKGRILIIIPLFIIVFKFNSIILNIIMTVCLIMYLVFFLNIKSTLDIYV